MHSQFPETSVCEMLCMDVADAPTTMTHVFVFVAKRSGRWSCARMCPMVCSIVFEHEVHSH